MWSRREFDVFVVLVVCYGDEVWVMLNWLYVYNAFDVWLRDGLAVVFVVVLVDLGVVRVVFDGNGLLFCSGGDFDIFGFFFDLVIAYVVWLVCSFVWLLVALVPWVEVCLYGSCFGVGIELSAFVGCVLADPSVRIGLLELDFGFVFGVGGMVSLLWRIGWYCSVWLVLWGGTIDVVTAFDWGLVDEVVALGFCRGLG